MLDSATAVTPCAQDLMSSMHCLDFEDEGNIPRPLHMPAQRADDATFPVGCFQQAVKNVH